jgi:2-phosphoglycerate kinase
MSKRIMLIGGMPTAGKSTLAEKLSEHLGLPWISTDQIGIAMRAVATRETNPELFTWEDYGGFQYLNEFTADEIADNEFAKGESVWPGVRQLILEDHTWNDGFIVEGDDILPHLVARDCSNSSNIRAVFIGDLDSERVRNVVLTRNFVADDASAYPDEAKEKEVDWVLNYGEKLKSQVLQYKMPWIEAEKNERDLAKVLTALVGPDGLARVQAEKGRFLS